jgi:hypothetical protein
MGRRQVGADDAGQAVILYAVLIAAIILAALFVFAAGRVSAEECCNCPYECDVCPKEYPEP